MLIGVVASRWLWRRSYQKGDILSVFDNALVAHEFKRRLETGGECSYAVGPVEDFD